MEGILIGEKHTWSDWELYLQSYHISMPEPKQNQVNLPGADGVVDFTDYPNGTAYNNRTITVEFEFVDGGYPGMVSLASQIAGEIQGKKLRLVFDDDDGYYYVGRCRIDSGKINEIISSLTLTVDAEPYKYENNTGNDWLWDLLDFETGIIREYENIEINGSFSLPVPGCDKKVMPVIEAASDMTLSYLGKVYQLSKGRNKFYNIVLGKGEHTLTFTGNGTVTVYYTGGMF